MTELSKDLRSILADLVAFPSVTGDYEQAAAVLSYIRSRMNGCMYERDFVSNDFPSLVLSTQKTERPKLTLLGHVDVVSAEPELFRLVSDSGRLYGRGVYDMKFAIACYVRLAEELGPAIANYDFALMLSSDEEVGGEDGVRLLVADGYQTDICVIPDGANNWHIEEHAKGAWLVTVRAEGVAAHGSRPWQGDNASQKLVNALADIQQLNTNVPDGTTVAVSQLQADTAINQIPDNARATLDVRFMTLQAYEQVRDQISTIARRHGCTVETFTFMAPIVTDLSQSALRQFMDIAAERLGKPLQPMRSLGSHDGKYFVQQGTSLVVTRPIGGKPHSSEEWIDEQSLEDFYQVLKRYVQTVARR